MENYIGMATVFAAIVLSKSGRALPSIILAYYIACIAIQSTEITFHESVFRSITMDSNGAAEWYLMQTATDSMIVTLIIAFCRHSKIALFYACIVGLSAIYNTFGLFFSALSMDWYSDVYLLHQKFAIQLDVVVAWLASDNSISRRVKQNWAEYVRREVE